CRGVDQRHADDLVARLRQPIARSKLPVGEGADEMDEGALAGPPMAPCRVHRAVDSPAVGIAAEERRRRVRGGQLADGAVGAEWLQAFKGYIEAPVTMLL
ncbi:MAG: hypothetical protein ACPHIV_05755, partial [Candidatus Puniceispirillaceae bacterium]